MPSAVIWDVGGTLLVRVRSFDAARNAALRRVGLDPDALDPGAVERSMRRFEERLRTWRTLAQERREKREIARLALDGLDPSEELIERFAEAFGDYYASFAPVDGIAELLAELGEAGVAQGVLSNWPPSLRPLLSHHDLAGYFDVIVVSGEEGMEKPDLRLFRTVLDRMGLAPEDAIYVGNSVNADIVPARGLGMEAVHFTPGESNGDGLNDINTLRRRLYALLKL